MHRPTRSVLIADEHPEEAEELRAYLQERGWAASRAEDGQDVLRRIAAEQPRLVIVSTELPVLDGFQVLETLRRAPGLDDIAVILIYPAWDERLLFKGMGLGADAHHVRPIDLADIGLFARRLLAP